MEIRINVKTRMLILVFLALLGVTTTVAGKVIYLDGIASGESNGSSWTQL